MTDAGSGFGERLRRAREARGLTLAQAERLTRIRAAHLAALEEERFERLPPPPYGKGFIRTYAGVLGLDPAELARAFEERLPAPRVLPLSRAAEIPLQPPPPPSPLRRIMTRALWVVVPLVIVLAVGLVRNVQRFARSQPGAEPQTVSTPAPPVSVPEAPPSPLPVPSPQQGSAEDAAEEPRITLVLVATGASWLRVTTDGQRIFEGILYAGDTATWTAERELLIKIGNAGAVQLTVNGQALGTPGRPAQVVTLRFPRTSEEP